MSPSASGLHPRLADLELVVFDKDGTLIEFDAMWGGWVTDLAGRLEGLTGRPLRDALFRTIGFDPVTGRADPHGGLAAMPMAVLRRMALGVVVEAGLSGPAAEDVMAGAWRPPDPVALARPLADLDRLFGGLRDAGTRVGIATSDDRIPTERTLEALGVASLVDAIVCADDGLAVKPDPAALFRICEVTGAAAGRMAMVGDSPADLRMGRAAGAPLCVGVLSGTATREELDPWADLVVASVAALLGPDEGSGAVLRAAP